MLKPLLNQDISLELLLLQSFSSSETTFSCSYFYSQTYLINKIKDEKAMLKVVNNWKKTRKTQYTDSGIWKFAIQILELVMEIENFYSDIQFGFGDVTGFQIILRILCLDFNITLKNYFNLINIMKIKNNYLSQLITTKTFTFFKHS